MVGGGTAPATNFTRQEVQRPRPPQVAVRSMPAAWAAARMLVAGGSDSSRRTSARRGSVKIVSATAIPRIVARRSRSDFKLHAGRALALHRGARFQALQALGRDPGAHQRLADRRD